MCNTKISPKSLQYIQEQTLDSMLYIQRNRDRHGDIIPLSNYGTMVGSDKQPVTKLRKSAERIEIAVVSLDFIKLKLITVEDERVCFEFDLTETYYMQFLFFDFTKSYNLFLFNTEILDKMIVPEGGRGYSGFQPRVTSLIIRSASLGEFPAYKIYEMEHKSV